MKRSPLCLIVWFSLLAGLALTSCSTKDKYLREASIIHDTAEETRAEQNRIQSLGGVKCGVKELAIADARYNFALHEIDEGRYVTAMDHTEIGKKYARRALRKAKLCEPPDRDGDGVFDSVDQCPDDPEDIDEYEDEDGCPDMDNDEDGLPDTEDKCPDDPEDLDGFEDEDGCPDMDNDNDGILDEEDNCPDEAEDLDGFEDEDGCPELDNDNDGILDSEDKCPLKAETFNGVDDEDGCPDQADYKLITVTGRKIQLKDKVYFRTGKATILPKSFAMLNEVSDVLIKTPQMKVFVEGHTDSQGSDKYNMDLSQKRAEAVKSYLSRRGVKSDQMKAVGYGESQPMGSNKTDRGRAMNRRVEFNILQEGESF